MRSRATQISTVPASRDETDSAMSTLVSLASLASLAAFAVVAARSSSSSSSSMVFERQHEQHTPITLDASVCRPEPSQTDRYEKKNGDQVVTKAKRRNNNQADKLFSLLNVVSLLQS